MKALGVYLDRNGISQSAFAADVRLSQPTVANLVNGIHSASSAVLKRISEKTGISVDDLLLTDEEWEARYPPPVRRPGAVGACR